MKNFGINLDLVDTELDHILQATNLTNTNSAFQSFGFLIFDICFCYLYL